MSNDLGPEVAIRIQGAWLNRKKASGIQCDKQIPSKLKSSSPILALWSRKQGKDAVHRLEVNEMRMFCWTASATKLDKTQNDYIRGLLGVEGLHDNIVRSRLRWFEQVLRKDGDHLSRLVNDTGVTGHGRRGRPKKRWGNCVKLNMETYG